MTPSAEIATAKVIAASETPNGETIYTVHARYWRPVHGELMTHRQFSRNGASGRAVPVASILAREETYTPRFKHNQPGMQPAEYLSAEDQAAAERVWKKAAAACREAALELSDKHGLNVSKQWANRLIEWFGWIDVLITSTEWSNFDALRRHPDAQDEIHLLADRVYAARKNLTPRLLKPGEWHLPYVRGEDEDKVDRLVRRSSDLPDEVRAVLANLDVRRLSEVTTRNKLLLAMSAARSCRVSFNKLDGSPASLADDMTRYLRLAESRPLHASPLEHQARSMTLFDNARLQGNFKGFVQFRKCIPGECL